MKRVILDTNIYGKVIEKGDVDFVLNKLPNSSILIYGSDLIRKELRDTPKRKIMITKDKRLKVRILLLELYDFVVKNHQLKTTDSALELAENYYAAYKKFGGSKNREEIINDFRIVSTAALNKLEVVYSEDNKSMISGKAVDSYELINSIKKLKTPTFKSYEEFKNEISKK